MNMNCRRTYVAYTLLLISGSVLACGHPKSNTQPAPAPAPLPLQDAVAVDSTWITLERTPCFGTCPVYKLNIGSNGAVVFDGIRFVPQMGRVTDQLTSADVSALKKAFDDARFADIKVDYVPGSEVCRNAMTDNPSAITSITTGGVTKTVRHYYGCHDAPASLKILESQIDSIARTSRWTRMK
jgi:hypothetical protein